MDINSNFNEWFDNLSIKRKDNLMFSAIVCAVSILLLVVFGSAAFILHAFKIF